MSNNTLYRFYFSSGIHDKSRNLVHQLSAGDGCHQRGNAVMAQTESRQPSFNDFRFYEGLCNKEGCVNVRISKIRVRHNQFCHGFQMGYESKFQNGATSFEWANPHFFQRGFYSYHGERAREELTWELQEDEYIRGLNIQQGQIMDGITFVTNQRQLHSGGHGGTFYNMMLIKDTGREHRIVAFSGTEGHGVLQRVGYYATPIGWAVVGPYVMLRWLRVNGRVQATPINDEGNIVRNLIDLDDGAIFRNILEYLI